MSEHAASGSRSALAPVPIDEDRYLLGSYHVVHWVLRSRGRVFAAADIIAPGQTDSLLRVENKMVASMLRHLARAGLLETVDEGNRVDATVYGNPSDATITYYRLTGTYGELLAGFARRNESERADLRHSMPPAGIWETTIIPDVTYLQSRSASPTAPLPPPASSTREPRVALLAGRYEARRLIGSGGMGAVYQGRDTLTGEVVAIKLLRGAAAADAETLARFRREAEIGMRMRHPHITRTSLAPSPPSTTPSQRW